MWITSTHNSIIVHCDLNGKTIAKYVTPGAGRIYEREDDPKGRSSPLKPAWPDKPRGIGPAMTGNVGNNTGKGLPPGQLPLNAEEGSGGTGAHAILVDGDYLIYACPPARADLHHQQEDLEGEVHLAGAGQPHPWHELGQDPQHHLVVGFQSQCFFPP